MAPVFGWFGFIVGVKGRTAIAHSCPEGAHCRPHVVDAHASETRRAQYLRSPQVATARVHILKRRLVFA